MRVYARLLGAQVGRHVDLHSVPPVTGHLVLGDGCSVEPEVDLSGHWLDGDLLRVGSVEIGADARIGARSTLSPGAVVGAGAEIAPGVRGLRRGARRSALGRGAGPAAQGRSRTVGRATPQPARLGAGVRRDRRADRRAPRDRDARRPRRRGTGARGRRLGAGRRRAQPGVAPGRHRHRPRGARPADPARGARARARPGAGRAPRARAARVAGVGDPARPRRGTDVVVPALLELADACLAARARCRRRASGGGLDGAADPQADPRPRRRLPRRRHPARGLRARRRLAARGARGDRQARVRRQLRDGRARAQGAQAGPRRRAVRRSASYQGEGGHVVAGQPPDQAAPGRAEDRPQPHVRPAHPPGGRPCPGRALPARPGDGRGRHRARRRGRDWPVSLRHWAGGRRVC